ncbi:MAG TPA: Mu transposase C-terminal domain-containing protein [Brevundimonas sp.]|jgi:putative transposase|uniref:Mu transposase C-terminal domain-containing protein n=1 Tax=Brevundimonas sp. TaxID=1871086 RepID=UPI002E156603|nr:Mu transposase C-terminal domain-containing protein [Brevundimonas sp.]
MSMFIDTPGALSPESYVGAALAYVPLSEERWSTLEQRARVLGAVAKLRPHSRQRSRATLQAAAMLGASPASVYRWLKAYDGQIDDLIGSPSGRPRAPRLSPEVRALIDDGLRRYFTKQPRLTLAETVRRIGADCEARGLAPPSRKAVQARLNLLDQRKVARARGQLVAAESLSIRSGAFDVRTPMAVWQIDHTLMDIMLVSARDRINIGRPWLTLIIDVATRMVAGYHLSLDAPSSHSVASALLNAVSPKELLLSNLGLEGDWPIHGLPDALHSDNAKEFSEAVAYRRGCANYGIDLQLRDLGAPHQGGHIERLIGTMMGRTHFLPGTTYSNPKAREQYDSAGKAPLTIAELERWFANEVLEYHGRPHSMLGCSPLDAWRTMCREQNLVPRAPRDPGQFYISFLPSKTARLQRQGIQFKTLEYASADLAELRRYGAESVEFRFDPGDLSAVFVQARSGAWAPVPLRHAGAPRVTLCEVQAELQRRRRLRLGSPRGSAALDEILRQRQQDQTSRPRGPREARRVERVRGHGHVVVGDHHSVEVWQRIMESRP